MAPFLSLVIQTRQRHETLGYAIETALMDPMPELEVIVSDNFSSRETAEVVRSFSDSRLKYVRTDRRLSMCDNWEFALGHATGDYIIYIGDDDAVMPGALSRLKDLHSSHPAAVYKWPTQSTPGRGMEFPPRCRTLRLLARGVRWTSMRRLD